MLHFLPLKIVSILLMVNGEKGIDYFESAIGPGLEGIVGKRNKSLYQLGKEEMIGSR